MPKKNLIVANTSVTLMCFVIFNLNFCNQALADSDSKIKPESQLQYDITKNKNSLMRCGQNSLYFLLKLHGVPISLNDIEKNTTSHPEGMSLSELRDASNALGLPTRLRKCSIPELCKNFRFPVIIYTNSIMNSSGHYMIVLEIDNDSIFLMDGTTGFILETTPQRLANIWGGYVLIPYHNDPNYIWAIVISLLFWIVVTCVMLKITKKNRLA